MIGLGRLSLLAGGCCLVAACGAAMGNVPLVRPQPPIGTCKQVGRFVGHAEADVGHGASQEELTERARDDLSRNAAEGEATHVHEVVLRLTPPDTPSEVEVEGIGYRCRGPVRYSGGSMLGHTDPRATTPPQREPGPAPAPPPRPKRPPPPPISPPAEAP